MTLEITIGALKKKSLVETRFSIEQHDKWLISELVLLRVYLKTNKGEQLQNEMSDI